MRLANGISQPNIDVCKKITDNGQIKLSKVFFEKNDVVTHSVTVFILCSHIFVVLLLCHKIPS